MSGTASLVHTLPASGDSNHRGLHSLKNSRRVTDNEPLLRFREAKKVLGDVYGELKDSVAELEGVYKEIKENDFVSPEQREEIEAIRDSIKTIMDTFQRDNMKVVFFGRTSNGKSTTINAMLHEKVLPQGMGHTTCCFLQVEGSEDEVGHLQLDDNPQKIDMKMLGKIGHALSDENSDLPAMGQDSLLRVFHPKQSDNGECRLLQNDVVILDSPGVDLSPEFDSWIDKHCLDADVFVLVSNAESTLTQAEKNFFLRVAKKLSKPNVFILNNRWDASAAETENIEDVILIEEKMNLLRKLQKFNTPRRDHKIRTFHEINVKTCLAYRKEMAKQRNGTDSYLLTQQRLSIHLIDFVDIPLKKNTQRRIWTDRVTSPLYTMTESGLEVNSDYFFPMESPYAAIQKSYLRSLADSLTRSHRKLIEICDFVERCEEHSQLMLPTLIAVLCDWVNGFLRDHTRQLDELRIERLDDPLQTLARLNVIVEDVEIVRAMIGEDAGRNVWIWEDIEQSWNRVFLLTQHEAIVKKRKIGQKLQKKWIAALLSTMDHIFETGRVPAGVVHFVLHK
ncbi:hypothetical protein CAEBREN_30009 [Caenorhabditis brenneri]|uniref:Dynamin-type G domain-containing protein n=1 Tax=Caenorhabditis brenneri TaxID=135651 RepID=G0NAR3_CAEBE|nr:hypothetical protein CAEBREN_30009 [Caenorhabditis brenneri]